MPSNNGKPSEETISWKENLEKIDKLTERLVLALNTKKATRPELSGPDKDLYVEAASAYFSQMLSDPAKMFAQQVGQFKQSLEYFAEIQNEPDTENPGAGKPSSKTDRRFAGELWQANPFFDMIRQQYLVSSRAAEETVSNLEGLDADKQKRIEFFTKQIVDLFSPANFLGTNPEALSKAYETRGQSLVSGLENIVRDLEKSSGDLSVTLSDPDAFEVGVNLASTPGSVVFQNRMFQLLQYKPTTDKVHQIPLLIIPPWINKFYILDLKEKNSFIKFAVDQGFTVFVMSWVNPDASYRDVGFDTYVESGLLEAVSRVKDITAQSRINTIGYCIGGTLLGTTLAYMARKGDNSIKTSTFFTTLVDFEDAGEITVFIDEQFLHGIEAEVDEAGYLDSQFISRAFSYLRSNDLVYGPAVKSYLMGEAPPAFDLLFWNGDSTNLPARMAKEYLRKLYQGNQLSNGTFEILGETLNLGDIRIPIYAIATKSDHIAPWKSSFIGLNKCRGKKKFVLAGSGHIAGIINPADSKKYGHWMNDEKPKNLEKWFNNASHHEGSWWLDWAGWLGKRSGKLIKARITGDSKKYPEIEPGPGSYVKK